MSLGMNLASLTCSASKSKIYSYRYTVDVAAPFPKAFAYHNMLWMKIAIAFGSLFGISTSLLGSVFSLPRAVYSMASDGLFFRSLAKINRYLWIFLDTVELALLVKRLHSFVEISLI